MKQKSKVSLEGGSKAEPDKTAMNFEIQNRSIRLKWFKYDTMTAVLTTLGLLVTCFQRYQAIYLLKNECIENGVDACLQRMRFNRY